MKTPSPQEAAKTDWAEKLAFELTAQTCAYDYLSGEHRYHLRKKIAATLLDANKNGYERGRKEIIEDISDVIADDKHADNLAILRAVVQYIDKSRLDLRKANGK